MDRKEKQVIFFNGTGFGSGLEAHFFPDAALTSLFIEKNTGNDQTAGVGFKAVNNEQKSIMALRTVLTGKKGLNDFFAQYRKQKLVEVDVLTLSHEIQSEIISGIGGSSIGFFILQFFGPYGQGRRMPLQ